MPNLFIIDGASGTGKSDFLKYCDEIDEHSAYIKKYTNKEKDVDGVERNDLVYLSKEEYAKKVRENYQNYYEYAYPSGSTVKYLILKSELDEQLRKNTNVFIIMRNVNLIKQIKSDYSKYINVNVVTVFLYCDRAEVERRITEQCKKSGTTDEKEIQEKVYKRLQRDADVIKDYAANVGREIYDHVMLNVDDRDLFHACVKNLVDKYEAFDNRFTAFKAFIIMPYTQGWEWTHFNQVKEAIAAGARQQGFIAERQDDIDTGSQEFIKEIKKSIKEAIICIGDLTLARPNCYYEIGLAEEHHELDAIILIKDKTEDKNNIIHSDVQGRNAETYTYNRGNFEDISKIVSQKIKSYKENHLFITDMMRQRNEKL